MIETYWLDKDLGLGSTCEIALLGVEVLQDSEFVVTRSRGLGKAIGVRNTTREVTRSSFRDRGRKVAPPMSFNRGNEQVILIKY